MLADLLDKAVELANGGQLAEAADLCRQILTDDPGNGDACNLLGAIHLNSDRLDEAYRYFNAAVDADGRNPGFRSNLGECCRRLGRPEEALEHFSAALSTTPAFHNARFNAALCLTELGRFDEAAEDLTTLATAVPDNADILAVLAQALRDAGRSEEALTAYRRVAALVPDSTIAWSNIGTLLRRMGRLDEAADAHRQALETNPGNPEILMNLGMALEDARAHDEAAAAYTEATEAAPDHPRAFYYLGGALIQQNECGRAIDAFSRAVSLDPGLFAARWGKELALPVLYDSEEQIETCRSRFAGGLEVLHETLDTRTAEGIEAAFEAVLSATNFLMHYQGRDDRTLQGRYGELVHRIVSARFPQFAKPLEVRASRQGDRLRIGFVSANFFSHSITKTHGRWITGLDPARFETFAYHLGAISDQTTEQIRGDAGYFAHYPSFRAEILEDIAAKDLDVLIFTDIGMQPAIQVVAGLRLAPVQCNGLGHPITSGLPTVDVALTSDLMEPADGDSHYSERLVRLPNLAAHYDWDRIERQKRETDAEPADGRPRYFCSQSLFKLLPQFDDVFPRIAKEIGACEFWFIEYLSSGVTDIFRKRMAAAFARHGLDAADYVIVHPRQDQQGFLALNQRADVLLDSFTWSGNNSSMEAMACGLPIVTWPGPFMRSRHTYAQMKMMGIEESIARDPDDYVAIAVRLGKDAEWRRHLSSRIVAERGKLYNDDAPIEGLARFLEKAARRSG